VPQHNQDDAGNAVEIDRQIAGRALGVCVVHQGVMISTSKFGGLWSALSAPSDTMVMATV